jgi:hypothetical protein
VTDNQIQSGASEQGDTAVRGGGIVKRLAAPLFLPFVLCLGAKSLAAQSQPSPSSSPALGPPPPATIALTQGTRIELAVIRPVWAISAKAGDPLYAQVSFPAIVDGHVALPAGAFVQGTIEGVTRPTRRTNRGEVDVLFTKIILANGYTVELPGAPDATGGVVTAASAQGESLAAVKVQATIANDLLLDNGAGIEMTLEAPLALDANLVAQAIPMERAPQPQLFKSATMCRFVPGSPGTPGTPDTVIPGTPGTPSTTVPGGPGMPDITIPGTPATPPTVIPGTPGTPGTPGIGCPPAPLVLSSDPIPPKGAPSSTSQPVAAK